MRVAQLIAIMATPYRFRTKRNLWPYSGLAVITRTSAEQEFADGKLRRRTRAPRTRGLNRNHNPMLKAIFKGAATAAAAKPGPLKKIYEASVARGTKPDLAKVTLARKIASIVVIGSRTSCLISRRDVSNIPRSVRLFSRTEATFFVRELVGSGEERLLKMFTMYTGAL